MAIYKIFPEKDATVYSQYPSMNSGIDEILEFSTYINTDNTAYPSRTLIKFAQQDIDNTINNLISGSVFEVDLKLYAAKVTGLNTTVTIETFPISASWNQGTGQYLDRPETINGVSWAWRYTSGSSQWQTSSYNYFTTASYGAIKGGGTWYTASYLNLPLRATASLGYKTTLDITLPVLNIIRNWYSESIYSTGLPNEGFIIKQTKDTEFTTQTAVELKYFSADTNTIYPPCLEFKWDDSIYNTSSTIPTISDTNVITKLVNNTGEYPTDMDIIFRFSTRPQYPPRIFTTSSLYTQNYYLPYNTCYCIKDAYTEETVVDYDTTYTRLSADSQGNFVKLRTAGLEPERYYRIHLRSTINNSYTFVDTSETFKIVNR